MASYVFQFDSATSNLSTWKVVDVDSTDSSYASPALGHKGISVSVQSSSLITPIDPPTVTVGVAWVDDTFGVTKYQELTFTDATYRRSSNDGSTGNYVYAADQNHPIRIDGIGPCIDARSSSVSGIRRRLMVGVVSSTDSGAPFTVIVTPTKIV